MSTPRKSQGEREITYQVGWKKGKIQYSNRTPTEPSSRQEKLLHHYFWRPVTFIPASFDFLLLCFLAFLGFAAILALVFLLNRH
ncbi:MAG: hypothetical protein JWM44_2942 [Bacilli bacterium]|nr:hypothetical protein [Bacilli bacterium]